MKVDIPDSVELHRPTLRTLNTACGSQITSNTSSGEYPETDRFLSTTGAASVSSSECNALPSLAGFNASSRMEALICSRAAWGSPPGVRGCAILGTMWKEYGNGSSSCEAQHSQYMMEDSGCHRWNLLRLGVCSPASAAPLDWYPLEG